ncbi:sensor histidine kinase [Rothia koreensis]|uniref:sensor histidine kinase n=1 Tax=Rothia koreensis TaxID=592378 RepID=UPI003F27004A
MSSAQSLEPRDAPSRVLQTLRIALHVMFAFLLGFGLIRYLVGSSDTPNPAPKICAVATVLLMGTVYLIGTVWENRYARARRSGRVTTASNPRRFAGWWLTCVTLAWIALLLISANFVWVVFPLMFLYLHLLRLWHGVIAVGILWALSSLVPLWQLASADQLDRFSPGSFLGPLLGAGLAIVISTAYRALHHEALHHQRVAEALRMAQAELAEKEHQAGRMEERDRLAREIHDTVAQGLSSIVLMSRAASASLTGGRLDEVGSRIGTIQDTASDNLEEARRFVRDLSSPALRQSLVSALESACKRTQGRAAAEGGELHCTLRTEGADPSGLPETVASALLRAAQEGLANVVKHARADIAVVTLAVWDADVALDVYDDGRGFDPAASASSATSASRAEDDAATEGDVAGGYGLLGLRRRLETLGGSLSVDSAPGEGTVVGVRIPLTSAPTTSAPTTSGPTTSAPTTSPEGGAR